MKSSGKLSPFRDATLSYLTCSSATHMYRLHSTTMLPVVFLLVALHQCSSFILDGDPCVVPPPCRCYSDRVDCASRHLDSLPQFSFSRRHYRELSIYLQNNQIAVLSDHAFNNISETGAETAMIDLSHNRIHSIHSTAFSDIGNVSIALRLTGNQLTFLPKALSNIPNLKELRLFENDIVFLSSSVLTSVRNTLTILWLDMNSLAIWPVEISSLHILKELEVHNVLFSDIPQTSFDGLLKLETLRIKTSNLHRVPDAICSLRNLVRLDFSENNDVQNYTHGILPTVCPLTFDQVVVVDMNHNNMHTFPDNVFSLCPTIRELGLSYNHIQSIDYNSVPNNCSLYYLYLSDNNFREIPRAVAKMTNLRTVIMTNNYVTRISSDLFSKLPYFRQLTINNNPILYLDPHAFNTQNTLQRIDLGATQLDALPAAILHSNDRINIVMTGSPVQCTCSSLGFMMAVPRDRILQSRMTLWGQCFNTTETIKYYILNVLPDCF